jgi:hypothetical protein
MTDEIIVQHRTLEALKDFGYELWRSTEHAMLFVSVPITRAESRRGNNIPDNTLVGEVSFYWIPSGDGIKYLVRGVVYPPCGNPVFDETIKHETGDWLGIERLAFSRMAPYFTGLTNDKKIREIFKRY